MRANYVYSRIFEQQAFKEAVASFSSYVFGYTSRFLARHISTLFTLWHLWCLRGCGWFPFLSLLCAYTLTYTHTWLDLTLLSAEGTGEMKVHIQTHALKPTTGSTFDVVTPYQIDKSTGLWEVQ